MTWKKGEQVTGYSSGPGVRGRDSNSGGHRPKGAGRELESYFFLALGEEERIKDEFSLSALKNSCSA